MEKLKPMLMKKKLIFIFLLFGLLKPHVALALENAGEKLAQRVYNRPDGKTMVSQVSMVIKRKGSSPRYRDFVMYSMEPKVGEFFTIIKFSSPKEVKDTVLLTKDFVGPENQQSIFLPALRRSRRISSNRMGGEFVGSHFTFEDMRDREVNEDTHSIVGEDKVLGKKTIILESRPQTPEKSTYKKKRLWIHPQTLLPLKIEFYDKKGDKSKVLEAKKVKKIGKFWTVTNSVMTDLKTQGTTELSFKKIRYDISIPESYFSRRTLEAPATIRDL